jgi:hypothetical protein
MAIPDFQTQMKPCWSLSREPSPGLAGPDHSVGGGKRRLE